MMAFRGIERFVTLMGVCLVVIDAFSSRCLLQPPKHPYSSSDNNNNKHSDRIIDNKSSNRLVLYSSVMVDRKQKKPKIRRPALKSRPPPNRPKFDPNFLRKRTANLLYITSPNYLASDKHLTTPASTKVTKKWKKADRRTFHWLMDSWAFSDQREGVHQALSLLRRMESIAPTHPHLAPDVRSYSKLINAYAKSRQKGAGEKAHSVLKSMLELQSSSSSNNDTVKPNAFLYTSVLEAYANSSPTSPTAAQSAESLCYEMHALHSTQPELQIRPTPRSYNAVINAWGHSAKHVPDSAERAESFLNAMEDRHAEGQRENPEDWDNPKPNTINYNSAIHAWANSRNDDAPNRSERLLRRMRERHSEGGDELVTPN